MDYLQLDPGEQASGLLRGKDFFGQGIYSKGMLKKISEMNKEELITHMKASGEFYRGGDRDSKAWIRAFKLYQENQGTVLDMDCPKCWGKVSEWLKK